MRTGSATCIDVGYNDMHIGIVLHVSCNNYVH